MSVYRLKSYSGIGNGRSDMRDSGCSVSMQCLLWFVFLFFCFFPYLKIIPIPTDSQPYALAIGIFIISAVGFRYLKKELYYLLIVALFSIAFSFVENFSFNTVRSVINYVSLFVVSAATYMTLSRMGNIPYGLYKFVIVVWLSVGLIQQFIYPGFGAFLISRMSEGVVKTGRGVTSLAPEPTFYAIICSLLAIVNFLNFQREKHYKLIMLVLFFQIFILSRSSTMILLVVGAFFCYKLIQIISRKPKFIFTLAAIIIVMYISLPFIAEYFSNYRIGKLLGELVENPRLFIVVDESVNERFIHAFFPGYAFFTDFGMPHFYGNFSRYMNEIYFSGQFNDYIPYYKSEYTRIMSGIGSAFFELGVIALLIVVVIVNCTRKISRYNHQCLFWSILFVFILINAMPLSNALIGLVFGNFIYRKYHILPQIHEKTITD